MKAAATKKALAKTLGRAKAHGASAGVKGAKEAEGGGGGDGVEGVEGVEVRRSAIHGWGVFALRRFRVGARIGFFRGRRTARDGAHVLWAADGSGGEFGLLVRNALRYVNHSPRPNAEMDGLVLRALRNIQPGREITAHYGEDWEEEE